MENNNAGNNANKPETRDGAKKLALDNAAIEANLVRPGRSWFYQLAVNLFAVVAKLLFFVRVEGRENLPEGACVIMGNHSTWVDPFFLAICAKDREIRFMGKKELWGNKAFAWVARQVRGIPVDRGSADMASIRMSMAVLKAGYTLGIFPEGTRSKTGHMLPLQGGAAMIALRSKCPVVPMYIDGSFRPFSRMTVRVGKPVEMDDLLAARITRETCDELTGRIAGAFAQLSGGKSLPPAESAADDAQKR
ncbi:MAG: 1-acyl-sn-glycerol-3-phosphate acyltransferase [Clostridia bacterium]|nr:1-acyl-sn-glycerol-3-phosphate acyltransferase [Clostridia bacterium]MBQ6858776.1 1-acyl-sn-glycerol-3-phosphate acyltransferase [Clostridia bacterium]MBQ7051212.1 1-acyl-sn-glycerol-3-phosphate acyltransferase [Clostridia bacterium]